MLTADTNGTPKRAHRIGSTCRNFLDDVDGRPEIQKKKTTKERVEN